MGSTSKEIHYPRSVFGSETSRRRAAIPKVRLGIFYLALALAGVLSILFLPDLLATHVTGWTAGGAAELGMHRLHIMGIATVVSVFLIGLFAQAYRPRHRVAAMWGAFATILIASLGTVWYGVGRPEEVLPFLTLTTVALVAHPAGRGLLRRDKQYSPALLGLLAIAAIPILAFVVSQLSLTTSAVDPHALAGHYVMMVALVMATLGYGIFAALRFRGWRLAAWLAAIPMAYYGVMSIAFPLQSGSTGALWGTLAILWAIVFIAVAEASRVRDDPILQRAA